MTTLLVQDPIFQRHRVPEGHPERPERMEMIDAALSAEPFAGLLRRPAEAAGEQAILAVHPEDHLARIRDLAGQSDLSAIDMDTFVSRESYDVACRGAGAACLAVKSVMDGETANAYVASRPPGHHAETRKPMGFCLFNNAAIAARAAQREHGAERVSIIDWDVHHGNGTQAIVWDDPSIQYASTHQMPLYPGTGAPSETGAHDNVVNAALAGGDGSVAFREIFAATILPAVAAYSPDLIIISAGFDAHRRDPLGGVLLETEDFAWATEQVMEVAAQVCGGRIVSLQEGGYDLVALAESAAVHVAALMSA